jgi:hypothetical protein
VKKIIFVMEIWFRNKDMESAGHLEELCHYLHNEGKSVRGLVGSWVC